jgi:hypothetical protein
MPRKRKNRRVLDALDIGDVLPQKYAFLGF